MSKPLLFTKPKCMNCELVKGTLKKYGKLDTVDIKDASDPKVMSDAIMDYDIMSFPSLVMDGEVYVIVAQILDKLGIK